MIQAGSVTAGAAARRGCCRQQATIKPRRGDESLARGSYPSNLRPSVAFHRHTRDAGHKLPGSGARTHAACAAEDSMGNGLGLAAGGNKWTRRQAWALLSSGTVLLTGAESGLAQEFQKPDANRLLSLAQKRFTESKVQESADLFDQAIQLKPELKQYLWQRGLTLYYAGRFEDGSEQFLTDVRLNPNDTEESIWKFMCDAQLVGFNRAQEQMLQVGKDRRPVMRAAYSLFQGNGSTEQLLNAGQRDEGSLFYAFLYAGLYEEARGEEAASLSYINKAVSTVYAQRAVGRDYMVDLAHVHSVLRGATMDS